MATRNAPGQVSDAYLNQYTVSSHQYPIDLDTSPEYGGNKIVFFINVAGEGRIAKSENNNYTVRDRPIDQYNRSTIDDSKNSEILSGTREKLNVALPMKRLTSAISLYMPNEFATGWNAEYGEEDMSNLDLVARGLDILSDATNANNAAGFVDRIRTAASEGGRLAASAMARSAFEGSEFRQRALRTTPGQSKMEQLFRRVNFRDFSFFFMFAPKSEREADNVLSIIRTFRHHMLPEFRDENQFLYLYPSEFDIKYYRGDEENEYLEKQFSAVLTNMSVNYAPMGIYNTFANGMPTQINMQLSFRELSVATKETSPFDKSGT